MVLQDTDIEAIQAMLNRLSARGIVCRLGANGRVHVRPWHALDAAEQDTLRTHARDIAALLARTGSPASAGGALNLQSSPASGPQEPRSQAPGRVGHAGEPQDTSDGAADGVTGLAGGQQGDQGDQDATQGGSSGDLAAGPDGALGGPGATAEGTQLARWRRCHATIRRAADPSAGVVLEVGYSGSEREQERRRARQHKQLLRDFGWMGVRQLF